MTGEEAEITEGIEEEMESMRRVEQRVAEFAARRASELARSADPSDRPWPAPRWLGPAESDQSHAARNAGRFDSPAATRSAGTSRSSATIRTPPSTRSKPLARTTLRTGSAPRRHQRRRRR